MYKSIADTRVLVDLAVMYAAMNNGMTAGNVSAVRTCHSTGDTATLYTCMAEDG